MKFVGKILVVLQVVMSIFFMAFAGAVYTVQTNWRDEANDLKAANSNLQTSESELREVYAQLQQRANAQLEQQKGRADDFEAKNAALQRGLDQTINRLEIANTERNTQEAIAITAGDEAKERRRESVALREVNANLHASRDAAIQKIRSLEDEIFNKDRSRQQLVRKHDRLLEEMVVLRRRAAKDGLGLDAGEYEDLDPPPVVQGLVLNTLKGKRTAPAFIEISIGSDDGLVKGHHVFVYRAQGQGKYLGQIRIVSVKPDRAVGTVVLPVKNGVIQRGDNVTTKL